VNLIRTIRLWFWWKYTLNKSEFSKKLDMSRILRENNLGKISLKEYEKRIIAKRQLAHELDIDDSFKNIWSLCRSAWYRKAFKIGKI